CFGRRSLEETLRSLAELEFNKFDVAIHEGGRQLRPSEVVADVNQAAQRLRLGPGLTPAAFSLEIEADSEEEYHAQFKAVCRLARLSAVPVVTLSAASADGGLEAEAQRLSRLVGLGEVEGVQVTVAT